MRLILSSAVDTRGEVNRQSDKHPGSYDRDPAQVVEVTNALVQQTVERLARCCPLPLLGEASREALVRLKPRLEEALGALKEIEGRRSLTHEEIAQRHAFKMLLTVRV